MKSIVFVLGACLHNRGAEAIIRGFSDIVRREAPEIRLTVSSTEREFSPSMQLPFVDGYVRRNRFYKKTTLSYAVYCFFRKIMRNDMIASRWLAGGLLRACKKASLVVVVGADHYDKQYGTRHKMYTLNQQIRQATKGNMLLLACSLDKNEIDDEVRRDFCVFDAITARDMVTYEGLLNEDLSPPIYYFPDTAFAMQPESTPYPDGFEEQNTVGVNISPLIAEDKYGGGEDLVFSNYIHLIQRILDTTDHQIMLLPHVMNGQDVSLLKRLYEYFKQNPRILLMGNETLNAAELKYLIAGCCFYIGARTHSTIAAYSSHVPTLVLGYSVKSIGIARDLFGKEDGYVVSVQNLSSDTQLADAFSSLYSMRDGVKRHLQETMPTYIGKTSGIKQLIDSL